MSRAAVLIGVNRTGGLPVLEDAVNGARAMERWALSQGIARRRVLVFTDEGGPVEIATLKRAIRTLVMSGSIEQLIVYFAGHGVNIRYGEYWLLSDAPADPSAAVNVEGSVVLARRSGIPHVVFISDACRTAAEGIQAQGVTGSEIFPNDPVPGPEQAVDIFFATTLGRPALEVKDPVTAGASFSAVYTRALLDAVSGRIPAAVKSADHAGRRLHLVQPRPLKTFLMGELPRRLTELGLSAAVSQVPDARITSDDDAWLAQLDSLPPPESSRVASPPPPSPGAGPAGVPSSMNPRGSAQARFDADLEALLRRGGDRPAMRSAKPSAMPSAVPSAAPSSVPSSALSSALSSAPSDAPGQGPECGVRLVGAEIVDCISPHARVGSTNGDRRSVRVDVDGATANLLLVIDDGSAVLVPVMRGYTATLVFDEHELMDVSFEPVQGTARRQAFGRQENHLHALRRLIADAARGGFFHPETAAASALARQLTGSRNGEGAMALLDPSLALYAAYALQDARMTAEIQQLRRFLSNELSVSFFDVDLLAGAIQGAMRPAPDPFSSPRPPFPMLSRGWSLLSAHGVVLPAALEGIEQELLPSLWTHFNPAGGSRLRDLMLARRM